MYIIIIYFLWIIFTGAWLILIVIRSSPLLYMHVTASAARSMAASDVPRRLEGKAAVVSASTDGLV